MRRFFWSKREPDQSKKQTNDRHGTAFHELKYLFQYIRVE